MKDELIHARSRLPAGKLSHKSRKASSRALAPLLGVLCLTTARALPPPPAAQILEQVRLNQAQQQLDLRGQLRSDATVIPFRLTQTGPIIRYTFAQPPVVLQLRLSEKGSFLELVKSNSTEKFAASRLDEKIGGTGVTFGDLALSFLYWPDPQFISEDSVRTRACWKLRLHPPSKRAAYATVILWVDEQSGAIMRLEAYNWQNQLAKKFEVVSAQKIEGRWFLKQMRIEEIDPGTGKVQSRSYLEINK